MDMVAEEDRVQHEDLTGKAAGKQYQLRVEVVADMGQDA